MITTTSNAVIPKLRILFAQFGLHRTIVTDNGPKFTNTDFKEFLEHNGIMHITSSLYHPSTNGLAERAIRIFKDNMEKYTTGNISDRIASFLLNYRRASDNYTS